MAFIGSGLESVAISAILCIDICTLVEQHLNELYAAFRGSGADLITPPTQPRRNEVRCEDTPGIPSPQVEEWVSSERPKVLNSAN
jgi:hypothetical protein